MRRNTLAALALIPLIAACSSTGGGKPSPARPQSTSTKPVRAPVRKPITKPPVAAEVHMAPGLESVIGASAGQLTRQFGTPRLDVWEGDARKLQFSGDACILDVYLYPPAQSREPQATYVEARRGSDGRDVDRASCVAALKR